MPRSDPTQPADATVATSSLDQEMASVDQDASDAAMASVRQAEEISVDADDEDIEDLDEQATSVEPASIPTTRGKRAAAHGFEVSDGFTYGDQERRTEDSLLDERVRERYIRGRLHSTRLQRGVGDGSFGCRGLI
ncbi:hypothetical protein ACQY0O_004493 [Thecaphora frezii]